MANKAVDVAIVGGGLAGGLIALACNRQTPGLALALIEKGAALGGNHRWSWFASDLDDAGGALMDCFAHKQWQGGYDVRFADYARTLTTPYRSLASVDFDAALMKQLPRGAVHLNAQAASLDESGVTLASGERIEARVVIDCRPFQPSPHLQGGWQIFAGQHLQLDKPHKAKRPIIMDADVDQCAPDGNGSAYRFVYSLPLGEREIFVEDTYYADEPRMDRAMLEGRITQYRHSARWEGKVIASETGILPVITGGDFAAYLSAISIPGVAIAGARGGFTHPLTSYTVPIAVENARYIAKEIGKDTQISGAQFAPLIERRAKAHWRKTRFYRMLGKMLFLAANPAQRDRIFALFYTRPQPLVERFYRAQSNWKDRLRILSGRPPVSIRSAMKALASGGKQLKPSDPSPASSGDTDER